MLNGNMSDSAHSQVNIKILKYIIVYVLLALCSKSGRAVRAGQRCIIQSTDLCPGARKPPLADAQDHRCRSNDPKRAAPPSWLLRTTTASADDVSRDFLGYRHPPPPLAKSHHSPSYLVLFLSCNSLVTTTTSTCSPRYVVVGERKYK